VLRAEIANRRLFFLRALGARVGAHLRARLAAPGSGEQRRRELAAALDQRPPVGLGNVHVDGDAGTTLRLDRRRCDQPMLDAVFPAEHQQGLRVLGFHAVRCGNDAGVLAF